MCTQTNSVQVCSECGYQSEHTTGPVVPCGLRGCGPLQSVDMNTDATCPGVEVENEEDAIDQCHNCRVLAEADRRAEEVQEERRRAEEEEQERERAEMQELEEYYRQNSDSDDSDEFEEVVV
jgi:hypothetical protein